MKGLKFQVIAAAAAICLAANAQQTRRITASKANEYGMAYTLPTTALALTLEAELTVEKPGEFYKYAKRYLNIDNPITAEKRTARMKSAVIQPYGIPDPERRYAITFKSGFTPFMLIGDNDVPLTLNTPDRAKTVPVELPEAQAAEPTPLETPAARQVVSEEMMQSQSTAKRAELAAAAIFAIRQTRSDLITGQAEQTPPDGRSLQLMLDNLEAQEQALMAMFVGTRAVSTDVTTVRVTPKGDMDGKVIARLSPVEGFVAADDLSGEPVRLTLKVISKGEVPVNDKGDELPFPKNGVAYCIPGVAAVSVTYDGKTVAEKDVEMAQFGIDFGLSPNLFTDKKAPIYVKFSPTTGAIIEQGPAQ